MMGSTEISILAAAGTEGGGAAIGQVIGMTVVALVIGALLCWLGYMHRTRKITWVNSAAEYAGRKFKRAPWVAVPMALFIGTLICALFGFIWDVSLHIGKGRDPGRWPTRRTTSSWSACSCSSSRAARRSYCPTRSLARLRFGSPRTGTRRSAVS